MAPSKKASTPATNGQTSHARSHSPAATKAPARLSSPTPSASHLSPSTDLAQEKSRRMKADHVDLDPPQIIREIHDYRYDKKDFSCLDVEVDYEFQTKEIELYVKQQEESVKTITEEFSTSLNLQPLINKDVDGEKRFFLDNEVRDLQIKIEESISNWKTQVLEREVSEWLKVRVEKHIRAKYTQKMEEQRKMFMELRMKLEMEHEAYVLRLKEEHRMRIRMAVLRAVTGTWAKYQKCMTQMKLELTVNFKETMISNMWTQGIGWESLDLDSFINACPHDYEPYVMLDDQRTLHHFRLY
jgi:hypothetical protein